MQSENLIQTHIDLVELSKNDFFRFRGSALIPKRKGVVRLMKCPKCGKEHDDKVSVSGICKSCYNSENGVKNEVKKSINFKVVITTLSIITALSIGLNGYLGYKYHQANDFAQRASANLKSLNEKEQSKSSRPSTSSVSSSKSTSSVSSSVVSKQAETEEEFKSKCVSFNYDKFKRNPDDFIGSYFKITGTIECKFSIIKYGNSMFSGESDPYYYWLSNDVPIPFNLKLKADSPAIYSNDKITIYSKCVDIERSSLHNFELPCPVLDVYYLDLLS